MLYYTNQELANTHHVSVRTVRNWIESARAGKLELLLHTKGAHDYIAITDKNISAIEKLVVEGKKFRPHRAFQTLAPKPEFYELYNPEQIHDIISSMEIYHELPPDYNYFDSGAASWDNYTNRLADDDHLNGLSATVSLLEVNETYIDSLLEKYNKVNVIDIGVGNAVPVKGFLAHLLDMEKLNRYIALDISDAMIDIAEKNVQKWFDGRVNFERHVSNFNFERFRGLLAKEYLKKDSDNTINLVLFFGGTLSNLRSPEGTLRTIHDSMGINDLLIYREKLDTAKMRQLFDADALVSINGFVLNLLNINPEMYDVELGYDAERHERYQRIRFRIALTLKFNFEGGDRTINLNKDDTLLVWRSRHQSDLSLLQQFDKNEFYTLHSSQTENKEYILTISRIKQG